ncbi:TetR/AcrR family transcriptional regulator [Nesterenkonia flava]|uniref:TetR/AcrR family transcriptional regulator n=1 Tax=Nesterenkonia flava TaxID=469799 RepID=A0ABU1FTQ2_9MICC|nr:TetR/AcrR family transcriptional regulator [Nesterenkonia flava]MDR5711558.1 TetR/AcrR family transcriptional regulator [Nesterenkonia flava]
MQEDLTQRERNQRDTWNAIHDAAFTLARDEGLQAATVDAIASRAGVSRRTLFNYFPTKEDAVLGARLPSLPQEIVERFTSSEEDDLTRVSRLLLDVLRTSLSRETSARRFEIVKRHPGLRGRMMQLLAEVEHLVSDVLHGRVDADPEALLHTPADERGVHALLMLAGTITKHAYAQYQDRGAGEVEDYLEDSVALFRKVVDETR